MFCVRCCDFPKKTHKNTNDSSTSKNPVVLYVVVVVVVVVAAQQLWHRYNCCTAATRIHKCFANTKELYAAVEAVLWNAARLYDDDTLGNISISR